MANLNRWHFYVRKGVAYVPTVAQTDAGFFLDIEPLDVIPVDDRDALASAIARAISAGNPVIAAPRRDQYPAVDFLLKAAGVKSWSTFENGTQSFVARRVGSEYEVFPQARAAGMRGWVDNVDCVKKLPLSSSHEDVARLLVDLVHS